MNRYILALLGHGTNGNDGLEKGIHLRWVIPTEMGFPLEGFTLYRRNQQAGPQPTCIDFRGLKTGTKKSGFSIGLADQRLELRELSSFVVVETHRKSEEPFRSAGSVFTPFGNLFRTIRVPEASFVISLPQRSYRVTLTLLFEIGGRITVTGWADGEKTGETKAGPFKSRKIKSVSLQTSAIDQIRIIAKGVLFIRICYWTIEKCDDDNGWERIGDPFCLPVYHKDSPCQNRGGPDCDELEILERLPKDACDRIRFEKNLGDLVTSLRTLIVDNTILPQAERLLGTSVEAIDCPPPDEPLPSFQMSVFDTLILDALDPVVARMLGLYYVDRPPSGAYDYKVVGNWPEKTLWSLPNSLTFEHLSIGKRFINNFFSIGQRRIAQKQSNISEDIEFRSLIRPTVVKCPSNELGLTKALSFFETDDSDWNLPFASTALDPHLAEANVIILFREPVGEVQVYLGQETPNVTLQAFLEDRPVSGKIYSSRREDVLAVHANNPNEKINRITLKGSRFWLYRIAWGMERISHGIYCAFTYGLSIKAAKRPTKPTNVQAYPLRGFVRKEADCDPLLEGKTKDARLSIGVNWDTRTSSSYFPSNASVAYDVYRCLTGNENDRTLLTGDQPVVITPFDDDDFTPDDLPEGWPPTNYVDAALEPGRYRYSVIGRSIFGARSDWSDLSYASPVDFPPPTPSNLTPMAPTLSLAKFLERGDPFLMPEEQMVFSGNIDEAIHLRWSWSAGLERSSPDARSFRVYYSPGRPNQLNGEVTNVGDVDVQYNCFTITVQLDSIPEIPLNLLAGRQLVQDGRYFRILNHQIGIFEPGKVQVNLQVRLPVSQSRPKVGTCVIPLDAKIPVEVWALNRATNRFRVDLRTNALAAIPNSGLVGSKLLVGHDTLEIDLITNHNFNVAGSQFTARIGLRNAETIEKIFSTIEFPLFTTLALQHPNTGAYKDYADPHQWTGKIDRLIPRNGSGDFDLFIRKMAPGDSPSLRQFDTHPTGMEQVKKTNYILTLNTLPSELTDATKLRQEMAFGISCLGPNDSESAVSQPVVLEQIRKGTIGEAEELAKLDFPVSCTAPADDNHLYASHPNFEGKSSHCITWPLQEGWTYQVYRALDETLYSFDDKIRRMVPIIGLNGRFANNTEINSFLSKFEAALRNDIRELVIHPTALDRNVIENHPNKDKLLQALASLPLNERAFTKLNLDEKHLRPNPTDPTRILYQDDTLEGRSKSRYFYRVRAINAVVNISSLGTSSLPVYLQGIYQPAAPVITKIEGGDRQITLHWAASWDNRVKGYLVYRTDDGNKTDMRLMEIVRPKPEDDYSVEVPNPLPNPPPIEYIYADATIEPRQKYFYGVVTIGEYESGQKQLSKMSETNSGQAYDDSRPSPPEFDFPKPGPGPSQITLSWQPPVESKLNYLVERSQTNNGAWRAVSSWLGHGVSSFVDQDRVPGQAYDYRLRVMDERGRINNTFKIITA